MPISTDIKKIKIISLGDVESGKSCLIKRFCEKRFVSKYVPTIGIDYGVFRTKVRNTDIYLNIFDMSGDSLFYDVRNEFYENTDGILLVFDLTKRSTFENLIKWIKEICFELTACGTKITPHICLCGNKCDKVSRTVSYFEASDWSNSQGIPYFETSASTGDGVIEAFNTLFEGIIEPEYSKSEFSMNFKINHGNKFEETLKAKNFSNFIFKDRIPTKKIYINSPKLNDKIKSEQVKFTQQHLYEINRICNAKSNHERLGISVAASREEITKAYRRLAFLLHPDKNAAPGSEEAFKLLVTAKNALFASFAPLSPKKSTVYFR